MDDRTRTLLRSLGRPIWQSGGSKAGRLITCQTLVQPSKDGRRVWRLTEPTHTTATLLGMLGFMALLVSSTRCFRIFDDFLGVAAGRARV
jgi:hypothetical protein